VGNREQGSPEWPPKIALCVGAVVLQEDRVLFVRQAKGQSLEGQWSIPWGVIEPDEPPEAAAVRETEEEGGVKAQVEGLLGLQDLPADGWVAVVFLCRHVSGEPRSDGGIETDGAAYLSLDEMEALGEPFEPWCEWLVRRVMGGAYCLIPPEPGNPYHPNLAFF